MVNDLELGDGGVGRLAYLGLEEVDELLAAIRLAAGRIAGY